MIKPLQRYLLLLVGWLATALGILGAFLPLLPTVPFLLLASYCFARSSARWHHWLRTNRLVGPILINYLERQGLTKGQLIGTLISLWCGMAISIYLAPLWFIKGGLLVIALGVTIHLCRLPRLPRLS